MKKRTIKKLKQRLKWIVPLVILFFLSFGVWVSFDKFHGIAGRVIMSGGKYLVVFQNEAESRPTGGFISGYAVVKTGFGMPSIEIFDSYELSEYEGVAPEEVTELLDDGEWYDGHHFRDANVNPDWKISAQELQRMYNLDSANGENNFDGIFAVNFGAIENLVASLDPEHGKSLFYELEVDLRPDDAHDLEALANRKNPLKDLAKGVMFNSMLPWNWDKISDSVVESLDQKDIQLYFADENLQYIAEEYNWAGRVSPLDNADYLSVNIGNYGGKKSDRYIRRSVDMFGQIDEDGNVKNNVEIMLRHRENEGLLTGDYFAWVRVYVPLGSEIIGNDGWKIGEENGLTVFGKTISVPKMSDKILNLEYVIPQKFRNEYKMKIQKQSGADVDFAVDVRAPSQRFFVNSDTNTKENHLLWEGKLEEDLVLFGEINKDKFAPFVQNQHFSDLRTLWVDTSEPLAQGVLKIKNFALRDSNKINQKTDNITITEVEHFGNIIKITLEGMTEQPLEKYMLEIKNQQDLSGNIMPDNSLTVVQRF